MILKILVVSRTGLAAGLNVDKSLVGRWASGAVNPSEHNLAKLTRYIGERIDGFTVLDWERDLTSFAGLIGAEQPAASSPFGDMIPASFLEASRQQIAYRGKSYCGLWRSTRASFDLPGRFIHDLCLIGEDGKGGLRFIAGVEGVRYEGFSLMLEHQSFSMSFDHDARTIMFSIYNGVARQRPQVLDGLNLATLRDAGGSPAASASILQRIGEVTGDPDKDLELYEEALKTHNPLAEEGSIDPEIARHLTRNVQSETEGIIRLLYGQTMSRGSRIDELVGDRK
ncbi:hypothetical protein HK107_12950 [Parvularcula sp. ZS-1/3]|uniref:HTH cro/C1-type domain-containing protein n=1 Tax=Parvularcula mediterranea TaxID=2732508 RepID=A0A7Y3RNA8_9PROT|nr:hypothetical protein [Parvularcula mediterranea]NNU17233.1 hypothetical protein [Parvularcula mediterranea]